MKNENDNISFHSDEEEGSSEDDGSREISLSEYSFHYSEEDFNATLKGIKKNSAETKALDERGLFDYIDNMTDEAWEELGRDISNNTHLTKVKLSRGALNDQKISFFFRELTRSSSIEQLSLFDNELSVAGVRSIVPFLQNTNSLRELYLHSNNIQSEGFNLLLRTLSNSPIEKLGCCECGIESIEIDSENIPIHLTHLNLHDNRINADGCRGLAKLLEGEDTTLTDLYLDNNKIDDEGVTILVDALRTNRSLLDLSLRFNDGISDQGQIMLLKLVNDVSSIKAALQSNHTLWYITVNLSDEKEHIKCILMKHRQSATMKATQKQLAG